MKRIILITGLMASIVSFTKTTQDYRNEEKEIVPLKIYFGTCGVYYNTKTGQEFLSCKGSD